MLIILLYVYIPALVINRLYQWTYPSNFYIQYCTVIKSINMLCTMCQNIDNTVKIITTFHILYIYYCCSKHFWHAFAHLFIFFNIDIFIIIYIFTEKYIL